MYVKSSLQAARSFWILREPVASHGDPFMIFGQISDTFSLPSMPPSWQGWGVGGVGGVGVYIYIYIGVCCYILRVMWEMLRG